MRADKRDFRSGPRGGDGLVRTFATGELSEFTAEDGFAGLGQVVCLDDEIGVGAPDDDDAHSWKKAHGGSPGENHASEVLFVRQAMD